MTADTNRLRTDDRTAKLWWAVPAATLLILLGIALFFGKPPPQTGKGTSYDASSQGFRAAYLLLEELKYPVVRWKRLSGGGTRWVLFPNTGQEKAAALDTWVRDGGLVVLADNLPEFARNLGLELQIHTRDTEPEIEPASGPGISHVAGGRVEVQCRGQQGEIWARISDQPAVTIYRRGRGEVWLVNRPEFLTNRLLREADNPVLLCRLADEMLRRGTDFKSAQPLAFDEYFHGMRDRPSVTELLFQPPTIWVTLQGLLLVGLLLWHYVPRFGTLRAEAIARRRSKEEFLDAVASLLERKGDYAEAYGTVRDDLVHELEHELGLPAGTSVGEMLREAGRRGFIRLDAFRRVFAAESLPRGAGKVAFVAALNELESARDEFFHGRHHR